MGVGRAHFILLLSMDEMQKKVRQRKSSTPCIIKKHSVCHQKHYPQATNNAFIWGNFKTMSTSQCFPPLLSLPTFKSEKDNCGWTEKENCLCTSNTHTHTIKTHWHQKTIVQVFFWLWPVLRLKFVAWCIERAYALEIERLGFNFWFSYHNCHSLSLNFFTWKMEIITI